MNYITESDIAKKLQMAKTMVGATVINAKSFGSGAEAGVLLGSWLDIMAREFIFNDQVTHYGRAVIDVLMANKKFTMDKSGSARDCAKAWADARYVRTGTHNQEIEQWTWNAVSTLLDLFVIFLKFVVLIRGLDPSLKQALLMKKTESMEYKAIAEWVELFGDLRGEPFVHMLRTLVRDETIEKWVEKKILFETGSNVIMSIRKVTKPVLEEARKEGMRYPAPQNKRRF